MKVIVDTSVWSLALRRNAPEDNQYVNELKELVKESRVQLIGPVRQELLNGIRHEKHFNSLKDHLRAFKDVELVTEDYELASEYFNKARQNGIQGSNTDFLICAISTRNKMPILTRNKMPILTTDKDFENFQSVLPVTLHEIKK